MATPFRTLKCDRCGERFSADYTYAKFVYELPAGSQIPLERVLCWCSICHSIQEMEDLGYSTLVEQLSAKAAELAAYSGLWNQLLPEPRKVQAKLRQEITETSRRIDYLKNRSIPPKCLRCGGTAVTALPAIDWPSDENVSSPSGLTHPGCGGALFASWKLLFISEMYPTLVHDPSGVFLREIEGW